jgi:flagellar biosynthetic protein FliO
MANVSKKRHLACFLSFIFVITASYAQDAASASVDKPTDETAIMLDGSALDGVSTGNADADKKSASPSSVWILVRIVVVLALVCAGIYGVVYLLKKSTGGTAGNDPYLKNIASLYFSPNKSIQVISLGDKAYMVGVTDQAINLLAEVSDRELIDAMNLQSDKKNPVPAGTFQNILSNFFPGNKKDSTRGMAGGGSSAGSSSASVPSSGAPGSATFGGGDFLKSQRERLQNVGRSERGEE